MAQVAVRGYRPGDERAVVMLWNRCLPADPITGERFVRQVLLDVNFDPEGFLVAEIEGQIVGMASSGPLEGHLILWKLYVLPQFQGHGAGSALMDAVLERAAQAHDEIRLAYLDGNVQAAGFYRSKGFVELQREVAGHGIPDSVWMSRALTPSPEEQP